MAEQRIDLNTATAEELTQLPGIGSVLAQRIIAHRETVQPYESAEGITAVSGIGERSYGAIADRLTAVPLAEASAPTPHGLNEARDEDAVGDAPAAEDSDRRDAERSMGGEVGLEHAEPEVRAMPPGESLAHEELSLEAEQGREARGEYQSEAEEVSMEISDVSRAEDEQQPVEEEVPEPQEETGPERVAEEVTPAVTSPPRVEPTPASPWWRRLSWLWIAILGGLLGMVFALVVFAGINGSLDVGHSRAVLNMEGEVSRLQTSVETARVDIDGLETRLDALEELTTRMENVESAVDDLRGVTADLTEQADALEQEIVTLSEKLQAVSDDVSTLQDQAEQTQSFFSGLQALLQDTFGELEGTSLLTPTPETK